MKGKEIEWKKDNYPLRLFICLISINIPVEKTKILTTKLGKISAQPHTTLCIQFLDRENNE